MNKTRTAALLLLLLGAAAAHERPLGDGKISNEPRRGYVFACTTVFPGGGGAERVGEWIDLASGTWTTRGKPVVEGAVAWPDARLSVTVEGDRRLLRTNSLPGHTTGIFPIRPGTAASAYDRNPNRITARDVLLDLPAAPQVADRASCLPMGMIGLMLSGVPIFNAFDLRGRDAPAHEIQDACNGHPERTGQYHYHDWSTCIPDPGGAAGGPSEVVGFALDGFPILGPRDRDGRAVKNADLDECHGRVGEIVLDGKRVTTYHYRFTEEYPYTLGCFRGKVDPALRRPPGPAR